MNKVSDIIKQVVATMSLEGMTLKKEEISLLRQCAEEIKARRRERYYNMKQQNNK